MSNYAIVENGLVTNVIVWDGNADEWAPNEGSTAQLLPDDSNIGIGYAFDGETFIAPPQPALSAAQIVAWNTSTRDALIDQANAATIGMSDAYVAGLLGASDTAKFKSYAAYKLAVSKVDLTLSPATWPAVVA